MNMKRERKRIKGTSREEITENEKEMGERKGLQRPKRGESDYLQRKCGNERELNTEKPSPRGRSVWKGSYGIEIYNTR